MIGPDRDRLLDMLGALPAATPSAASTERLRSRCHAALTRASRSAPSRLRARAIKGLWVSAWLLYLAAAIGEASRFVGLRP